MLANFVMLCRLLQNKMHPREWNRDVQFRGRVRVQIKQEDGNPCQEKFNSRECVMLIVMQLCESELCQSLYYSKKYRGQQRSDYVKACQNV